SACSDTAKSGSQVGSPSLFGWRGEADAGGHPGREKPLGIRDRGPEPRGPRLRIGQQRDRVHLRQRARTMLEVEKVSPAMAAMSLHMFVEYVKQTKPPAQAAQLLGPLERGEVEIRQGETEIESLGEAHHRRAGEGLLLQAGAG